MKTLNTIYYWLTYPLRLYFRKRVSAYKYLLESLKILNQTTVIKSRRVGFSETNTEMVMYRLYVIMRLENFIKRWGIKSKL